MEDELNDLDVLLAALRADEEVEREDLVTDQAKELASELDRLRQRLKFLDAEATDLRGRQAPRLRHTNDPETAPR